MRAVCLIRKEPYYRRAAFEKGLQRVGFTLVGSAGAGCCSGPEDWLIIWNRQNADERMADQWEARGGTVIVAENGYLQKVDKTHYAISVHGHNGSGWFPVGDEDRFTKLGFEIKPWAWQNAKYRLICGQRGIGSRTMRSPPQWAEKLAEKFKRLGVAYKLRNHPGNFAPKVPLTEDLKHANVCAIWSSAAGVQAIVEGVEVHHSAPHWICSGVGESNRVDGLNRMAWGQWRHEEIALGIPFANIIERRKEAVW